MKFELGLGAGVQPVEVPDKNILAVLTPNPVAHALGGEAEVRRALENPIGSPRLNEIVKPGETVAIITSDVTRPDAHLRGHARAAGRALCGRHPARRTSRWCSRWAAIADRRTQERLHLAGERAFSEIRCVDGDASRTAYTWASPSAARPWTSPAWWPQADRRICLGNIEYHYFAGYSGGAKAIMPGVSTRGAIQSNHSMMVSAEAPAPAIWRRNPLRRDIEEAAGIVGVDFIVNVVLDEHKQIVHAVAGDVTLAHREGCRFPG